MLFKYLNVIITIGCARWMSGYFT